jgi:hypothetical protein
MRASLKKSIALSLAGLTLAVGIAASATPASAHIHFGGGGFGGGWNHGGFGGGWNHGGWNHFGWHHGFGVGYVGGYDDDSCIRYRPMYDSWGNFVGRNPVNVCD